MNRDPRLRPAQELRTPQDFYMRVDTTVHELNHRLRVFIDEYTRVRARRARPLRVLDVGCGRYAVLSRALDPADSYVGCDIAPLAPGIDVEQFHLIDVNAERIGDRIDGEPFDLVFCGEVVEHVFSPDALMEDLKGVMGDDGVLIVSTPNLAYWVNRLLLLVGISPLFVENSSRTKLGRRLKALGQGNPTEGHIRLFTYRAMRDFLSGQRLTVERTIGSPVWSNGIDRVVAKLAVGLAPDITYVAVKQSATSASG
jgi:2-polyprenyl-3-methyl-5-hydroxy-6-metoxy-1,4-benzoquinol methylase